MQNSAIYISDLHVSYYGIEALKGISLSIDTGNLVGIIGPNGAGKSTFLKAMLNLIPTDKGEVKVLGNSIKDVRKQIAYVPQRSNIDWDFPITVLDAVLIGTYPHLMLFKRPKKKEKEWALECLERVSMQDFRNRQISELSGGQQQRVFLARALAQKADLFFLDEPFVGIDIASEETIVQILKDLCRQGKTVIVVHHDLSKANDYFHQLILLNKELIGYGSVDKIFKPEVIKKAYNGQFAFLTEIGASI